jgi:hypothetical protein
MLIFTGEAGRRRGVDPGEHARDWEANVIHRGERVVIECVEADGDARKARGFERPGIGGQSRAVGGHGYVGDPVDAGEHRDELLKVAAQQRLAAGQAELRDSLQRERPGQARDLLERQQLGAREEREVAPEDLFGHAVGAAEVAAVGNRDPQVAQRTGSAVKHVLHSRARLATGDDERQVDHEQRDHDVVEHRGVGHRRRDLHDPPERKRADQGRRGQELAHVLVVGEHIHQVRSGGEEQRRALEQPGCNAAPARPDAYHEHAAEDAARDQPPRDVTELPLSVSHRQLDAGGSRSDGQRL